MAGKVRPPKIRDHLMVALIKGATKSAVHVDRKKQESKRRCRRRADKETE
jgi:hypothetical protein